MTQHTDMDFESLGALGATSRRDDVEDGLRALREDQAVSGAADMPMTVAATSPLSAPVGGLVAAVCVAVCLAGLSGLTLTGPSVLSRRRLADDPQAPVAWPQALEASSAEWPPHELADHDASSAASWPPFSLLALDPESLKSGEEWPPRPVAPTAVSWPLSLQPELLACAPTDGSRAVLAFGSDGAGALVHQAGLPEAGSFSLEGLTGLGAVRSATWGSRALMVVTTSGKLARCPPPTAGARTVRCRALAAPTLPAPTTAPAAVLDDGDGLRVAVVLAGRIALLELKGTKWAEVAAVTPEGKTVDAITAVTAGPGSLLATASDGTAFYWRVREGVPMSKRPVQDVPFVGSGKQRMWHSSCLLGDHGVARLATTWIRDGGRPEAQPKLKAELLL